MNKIILKCYDTETLDWIILTETTTPLEIKKIIDDIKLEVGEDYTIGNIINKLPKDCKIFTLADWSNNFTIIYY